MPWSTLLRARSLDVTLGQPIAFAFIDGLHDARSVRADHDHLAPHVLHAGLVAFLRPRRRFRTVISMQIRPTICAFRTVAT